MDGDFDLLPYSTKRGQPKLDHLNWSVPTKNSQKSIHAHRARLVGVRLVPPLPLSISCYQPAGKLGGISSAARWSRWGGIEATVLGNPNRERHQCATRAAARAAHLIGPAGLRSFCPRVPPPCGAAFHIPDTFSGPRTPRSAAQRTEAATSLPSASPPMVAPRPGVASFPRPGPCADSAGRLPGPGRGFGDSGRAPAPTR